MNWKDLRSRVEHQWRSDPSKSMLLCSALSQIEECLSLLSRNGLHWHLEEGHEPHREFPKTLYHYTLGPRMVRSEWEQKDLGEGWYSSPGDAEIHEGMDFQFAGRGGVRRKHLPSTNGHEVQDLMPAGWKEREKEAFLASRPDLGPILSDSKGD
jgi:hypothetical protein